MTILSIVFNQLTRIIFCPGSRGPNIGFRGKVITFEENDSSKVGVRFDRSIPEGCNLGGHCEDDRGFYCPGEFFVILVLLICQLFYHLLCFVCLILPITSFSIDIASSLCLDSSGSDDVDKIVVNELFEVCSLIIGG